ncbi:MAG: phosphoenolpyruvate synthase, partial [Desulfovibrionaceae bacterium]
LDPATQSAYFSEKNYFLLSREYCSLYSRFGFHFVSTEGRLGPHKSNNALVFQLRGGAANVERRIMRVRFVADILWECGLEPVLLHDSVRARVANIDVDNGLAVLSVLGYLTIHTRQLDMIMADKRQVLARKEAMLRDCKELLLTTPSHEQL